MGWGSIQKDSKFLSPIIDVPFEPHRQKTGFLPRRKQRRRSASR